MCCLMLVWKAALPLSFNRILGLPSSLNSVNSSRSMNLISSDTDCPQTSDTLFWEQRRRESVTITVNLASFKGVWHARTQEMFNGLLAECVWAHVNVCVCTWQAELEGFVLCTYQTYQRAHTHTISLCVCPIWTHTQTFYSRSQKSWDAVYVCKCLFHLYSFSACFNVMWGRSHSFIDL